MKKTDYLSALFVGIDIGSRTNVISAIDFDQDYYIHMKPVPNAQNGASTMEEMLCDVLNRHHDFKFVMIAMESTSNYALYLANYLSSSDLLAPFSSKGYVLNPKLIKNYKGSFVDLPKNDGIDSFVIADFARSGKIKTKPWRGPQYLALQRLTRRRLHIAECITREKQYLLNNVFLKFSEFALLGKKDHPFSSKYGATAEAILTEFTTNEELVNTPIEELVELINTKSRGRIADPEKTASILKAAARNSYRLDKCLYEPLTVSISCSFNCISAYEGQLKAINKAIDKTVRGLNPVEYQILNSIPRVGPVYAAGILAEIGSIKYFKSNDALAKYAGIVWNSNDSGEFEGEDTHMSKAGNPYLRYFVIEATSSVIMHAPEFKAFYDRKFAETTTHRHKRALALTSRKFLRMLFGLPDKGQLYSPERSR